MLTNFTPNTVKVKTSAGVTLVGGGAVSARDYRTALALAPCVVAADSGADKILRLGGDAPQAVIGDMDSISPRARAAYAQVLHHIPNQDSTDFDKALGAIEAPFVLGLGFMGARMDHGLAVLSGLLRRPDVPCILLGGRDVIFLAPLDMTLHLPRGARVSLFPMGAVTGRSTGLKWAIDGIAFAPDGVIGTSNCALGPKSVPLRLRFSARKMLVILPRAHLAAAMAGLGLGRQGQS
jgi:thiamine pyrophosphokinase